MTQPQQRFTWPRRDASPVEILRWGYEEFGEGMALCTSFQAAGSVILDMAVDIMGTDVTVFTIDTGRLHEETYALIAEIRRRYGIVVEQVAPDASELGSMLTMFGPNLFYDSVAKRKLCCEVRKVRPLKRRLSTLDAWVTGLRRLHGDRRTDVERVTLDEEHGGIVKLAPLADWTEDDVFAYAKARDLPLHPLYGKGYRSIGCGPCTRAVTAGEASRAGRWWWEGRADKECGMHFSSTGQLRREFDLLLDDVLPTRRPYIVK